MGAESSAVPLDARAGESRAESDDHEGVPFGARPGETEECDVPDCGVRDCVATRGRCGAPARELGGQNATAAVGRSNCNVAGQGKPGGQETTASVGSSISSKICISARSACSLQSEDDQGPAILPMTNTRVSSKRAVCKRLPTMIQY